ncbi:MAG: phytanoyl-CoA dioxygenase family protein [Sphingomonas sp.]|uniref:phytanoyl-CoA dioxygenase family protein n=1 Tax=Sphingomonas sp. TaxID=28214 RepID=UPI0025E15768|nr:phytanoyl-CoA dioxygenase family protein [Sphingomonas sp.]MBX9882933.1 phytanoyl-CoA dioxygenase family protein [Sphingomonas sp.]
MSDPLDAPYPLDPLVIDRFREQGFIRLKQVLPADLLADYGAEITRLTLALNTETRPLAERDTYDRAFLQVMNLWRHSEKVRRFVFGKRLAGIAARLIGAEGVRLYHDQSLYKEPSGGITPAHADQYYWPFASDKTVTVWIPLQPVPPEMGPLAFFAGSHREAFGRDLPISDESEAAITAAMEARAFPLDEAPYDLGEASFHLGWTFHRAGANRAATPRSVMTMIYFDRDMRVAAPANMMQANDLATWLPGVQPGEPAASPLNPVLFEAA